jgi:hypothetical protein
MDEETGSDLQQRDRVPDLLSPAFCRQEAEECLDLSYQILDPKGQVAVLKLANWWMRMAEHYHSQRATDDKASAQNGA